MRYLSYAKYFEERGNEEWAQCYCGKVHKVREDQVCPECGRKLIKDDRWVIDKRGPSYVPMNHYIYVNGDIVTLKFKMESVVYDVKYPIVGKNVYFYGIRFDTKKRTTLTFIKHKRRTDKYLYMPKEGFYNMTVPVDKNGIIYYYDDYFNNQSILELAAALHYPLSVVPNNPISILDVPSLSDLIFWNRFRGNYKDVAPYLEVYKDTLYRCRPVKPYVNPNARGWGPACTLKEMKDAYRELCKRAKEENKFQVQVEQMESDIAKISFDTNTRRRFIKEVSKEMPDPYRIIDVLLLRLGTDPKTVEKKMKRYYIKNPSAIVHHSFFTSLIENFDTRRSIMDICLNDKSSFAGSVPTGAVDTESMLELFGVLSRKRLDSFLSRKIKTKRDVIELIDTIQLMRDYRRSGMPFSLDGTIREIHTRLIETRHLVRDAQEKIPFENTKDEVDYEYDEYTIKYGKTGIELVSLGRSMNICVGSYSGWCRLGQTIIFYVVDKDDEPVACCELDTQDPDAIPALIQAKGRFNKEIPMDIRMVILKHCIERKFEIRTNEVNLVTKDEYFNQLYMGT